MFVNSESSKVLTFQKFPAIMLVSHKTDWTYIAVKFLTLQSQSTV